MGALLVKSVFTICMVFQFVAFEQEAESKVAVVSILVADLTEESDETTYESLASIPSCNVVVLNNLKSNLVEALPKAGIPLDFGDDSSVNPLFDSIPHSLKSETRTVATLFANSIVGSNGCYSFNQFDGTDFGNDDFRRPFFHRLEEQSSKHEFGIMTLNLDPEKKAAIDQLVGLARWAHSSTGNPPTIIIIKFKQPEMGKFITERLFQENCEELSGLQSESILVLANNFEKTTTVKLEPCTADEENKNVSEMFTIRVEFEVKSNKGSDETKDKDESDR